MERLLASTRYADKDGKPPAARKDRHGLPRVGKEPDDPDDE